MRKFFTREFYTRKRTVWAVVVLAILFLAAAALANRNGGAANIQTMAVERQRIEQTVLATGEVVSSVDLSLSFQASGVVRQVLVNEGQSVRAGQVLATLDRAAAQAALTSARGALAQAQANYDKVLAGASSEDVRVSEAAVAAAKTTLANAYSTLLNSGLAAIPAAGNTSDGTITVTGTYTGSEGGEYLISIEGTQYRIFGRDIEEGGAIYEKIKRGAPISIGTRGLYITFSSTGDFDLNDRWTISIPNTQASTYLTNLNAHESAKSALAQAEAALALKKAEARPPDLEAARAQVVSAQGQVAAAQAAYNNTAIVAPSNGTVTRVDIKVGEQAVASQVVMILQDVGDLHAEAEVSEADIAAVRVGQDVDYTFDALGPDRHFAGAVEAVNPASTVVSGIVNYKVVSSIEDAPDIRPGMTANMTILIASKEDALAVPSNAVLNKNGGKYVRVVNDPDKKTYDEVAVTTGLNADGGLVEIISGLEAGQEIVVSSSG